MSGIWILFVSMAWGQQFESQQLREMKEVLRDVQANAQKEREPSSQESEKTNEEELLKEADSSAAKSEEK